MASSKAWRSDASGHRRRALAPNVVEQTSAGVPGEELGAGLYVSGNPFARVVQNLSYQAIRSSEACASLWRALTIAEAYGLSTTTSFRAKRLPNWTLANSRYRHEFRIAAGLPADVRIVVATSLAFLARGTAEPAATNENARVQFRSLHDNARQDSFCERPYAALDADAETSEVCPFWQVRLWC
jgi:hypothetical protein